MQTFDKVCKIIADNMGLDADFNFTLETDWADLDADSLDVVDVIMSIEEEFAIEISDWEIRDLNNLGDLVSLIDNKQ